MLNRVLPIEVYDYLIIMSTKISYFYTSQQQRGSRLSFYCSIDLWRSVRNHISSIFSKLQVTNRLEAILCAKDADMG